ncbi:MAG: tetratricopeptide repeat protein [Acidobacteriota bacterium]
MFKLFLKKTSMDSLSICFIFLLAMSLVTISFPATAADAKIQGKVVDENGNGLAGVEITLQPEQHNLPTLKVKSKKNGTYFFGMVKPDNYGFTAEKEEYVLSEAEIVIMDDEKKVKEKAKGMISPEKTPPPPIGVESDVLITLNLTMRPRAEVIQELANTKISQARSLLNEGRFEEVLNITKEILSTDPDNSTAHYLQGSAYLYLKDNEKATTCLKRSLALNPDQEGAHFSLGQIYYNSGKMNESIEEFNKELQISTDNPAVKAPTYLNLGIIYRDLKDLEKAAGAFEKAIEINPKEISAYSELATIYTLLNKPEKAEEVVSKIQEIGSQNPDIYFNLGVSYYNRKNYPKAAEEFQKVIDIKPDYALAYKLLASSMLNMGENEKAILHLKKYLELALDAPDRDDIEQIIKNLESN